MNDADLEKYLPYLDKYDLSHTEKIEWLETLHVITESFVDLAFNPPEENR